MSLKLCFAFCDKSLIGFAVIGMLHANRLRLSFTLERRVEIHVELAIQHLFRFRQGECRTACESLRKLTRHFHELRRCDDTIIRSEEHTSELQSQSNLVCRLLLEKKKKTKKITLILYTNT